MGTKVNSNYEDLLTFTRASKGHALRPVSYGTELVTNGDFSSSDGWTLKSNTTISGGRLTIDTTSDSSFYSNALRSDIDIVAGKIYYYEVDIESQTPSDQLWVYIGGGNVVEDGIPLEGTGVITGVHIPTKSTSTLKVEDRHNTTSVQVINSISIKEVTFDQPDGTLTLFEHPVNLPRVEWDSAGNRLGLLVEEARTNLITHSQDITDAAWARVGMSSVSAGADAIVAPDGTQTADTATENNSVGTHYLAFTTNAVSANWTLSAFIKKKDDGVQVQLRPYGLGNDKAWATFDPADGSLLYSGGTNLESTSTTDVGNGWYRFSITCNTALLSGDGGMIAFVDGASGEFPSYTGQNKSFYIWGAQLEAGSFPTSYIKTTGATATRSADVASLPVADFGYNDDVGTVVINFKIDDSSSNKRLVSLNAGNNNNRMDALLVPSNTAQVYVMDGGVNQTNLNSSTTYADKNMAKVAFSYKKDDYVVTLDSGAIASDTSATVPTVTTFTVGTGPAAAPINGYIKSIQYYPRRLTNAQLQALTEPRSTPTLSLTFDGLESSYTENYIHG